MDALLMCGGRGTRLALAREKPLVRIDGVAMIDRVRQALTASTVDRVYTVTSPHTPNTTEYVTHPTIEAPGDGYVADLQYALERVDLPVLTSVADVPLLTATDVDRLIASQDDESITGAVPLGFKHELGVSTERVLEKSGEDLAPCGVNIVGTGPETVFVFDQPRLAVNVNDRRDARIAETLLDGGYV